MLSGASDSFLDFMLLKISMGFLERVGNQNCHEGASLGLVPGWLVRNRGHLFHQRVPRAFSPGEELIVLIIILPPEPSQSTVPAVASSWRRGSSNLTWFECFRPG